MASSASSTSPKPAKKIKTKGKSKSKPKHGSTTSHCLRAYLQQPPSKENRLMTKSDAGTAMADAPNAVSRASEANMSMYIEKIMVPFKR
ncbi:hypothetical protein PG994_008839 [Apiospora phragmitis]|uniref:Histone H2B n=1 Tax=Apiospora phragmitis TaxID=2905665 RepID=A0ABR1UHL6_9PEZI